MAAPGAAFAGQPGRRAGHRHAAADPGNRPQAHGCRVRQARNTACTPAITSVSAAQITSDAIPSEAGGWPDPAHAWRCDENTIAVVVTLGQTFTGLYEDVAAISAALDRLQQDTGLDVDIHVDAASGGFLAPFTEPDLIWNFRLPRVKSVNAFGHKMGLAPLGCGWVLWRAADALPKDLIFDVNYLGRATATFNLNFSRPGGQIITQYYAFVRLGREGYARVHAAAYETSRHLAREIGTLGPFAVTFDGDPANGITAATWRLKPGLTHPFSLFDFAEKLRARGWLVPAYTLPADREDLAVQRIIVRHGFSHDMADLLLDDMRRALASLQASPPARSPLDRRHERLVPPRRGPGHRMSPAIAPPAAPGAPAVTPKPRTIMSVPTIAMLTAAAIVTSLRGLPLMAEEELTMRLPA